MKKLNALMLSLIVGISYPMLSLANPNSCSKVNAQCNCSYSKQSGTWVETKSGNQCVCPLPQKS